MNDSTPLMVEEPSERSAGGTSGSVTRPEKPLPPAERGFMRSSMVQLTLVRFREFIREPEAVFWTFVFPILLAAGLGIAFRQRGPDKVTVGVVGNGGIAESLSKDSTLVVRILDDSAGARALRTGKIALL